MTAELLLTPVKPAKPVPAPKAVPDPKTGVGYGSKGGVEAELRRGVLVRRRPLLKSDRIADIKKKIPP